VKEINALSIVWLCFFLGLYTVYVVFPNLQPNAIQSTAADIENHTDTLAQFFEEVTTKVPSLADEAATASAALANVFIEISNELGNMSYENAAVRMQYGKALLSIEADSNLKQILAGMQ
jgi:hypothetical protein